MQPSNSFQKTTRRAFESGGSPGDLLLGFADGGQVSPLSIKGIGRSMGFFQTPAEKAAATNAKYEAESAALRQREAQPKPVEAPQKAVSNYVANPALATRMTNAGLKNGGKIEGPGTATSDSIPARVSETGEPISVSTGERIVSVEQEKVLVKIAKARGFNSVDEMFKADTGKPVGPTVKGGKLKAATGKSGIDTMVSDVKSAYNAATAPPPKIQTAGVPPFKSDTAQMMRETRASDKNIKGVVGTEPTVAPALSEPALTTTAGSIPFRSDAGAMLKGTREADKAIMGVKDTDGNVQMRPSATAPASTPAAPATQAAKPVEGPDGYLPGENPLERGGRRVVEGLKAIPSMVNWGHFGDGAKAQPAADSAQVAPASAPPTAAPQPYNDPSRKLDVTPGGPVKSPTTPTQPAPNPQQPGDLIQGKDGRQYLPGAITQAEHNQSDALATSVFGRKNGDTDFNARIARLQNGTAGPDDWKIPNGGGVVPTTNADLNIRKLAGNSSAMDTANKAWAMRGSGIQASRDSNGGLLLSNSTGPEKMPYVDQNGQPTTDYKSTRQYNEGVEVAKRMSTLADKMESDRLAAEDRNRPMSKRQRAAAMQREQLAATAKQHADTNDIARAQLQVTQQDHMFKQTSEKQKQDAWKAYSEAKTPEEKAAAAEAYRLLSGHPSDKQPRFTVVPEFDDTGMRTGTVVLDGDGKPVNLKGGQQGALPPGLVIGAPTKQADGSYPVGGKTVVIKGGKVTEIK